ncbi:MAG: hypothetical protein H7Y17_04305 [Chlorobia bacterium]|nr:hypothetical protein [Fimbriimonadaceae bacterium]
MDEEFWDRGGLEARLLPINQPADIWAKPGGDEAFSEIVERADTSQSQHLNDLDRRLIVMGVHLAI